MHSGLKNVVEKSLERIWRGPKSLDKSEIEIIDKRGTKSRHDDLITALATSINPELPWFRKLPGGQLVTPQEPIFGYYALRNILRGLFLGASFVPPGDTLLATMFLSPSIAMYYTASFHLILAYLALQGRVAITPVCGPRPDTLN